MKFVTFERRPGSKRAGILISGNRVLDLGRAYSKTLGGKRLPSDDTAGLIDSLRGLSSSLLEILKAGEDSITHCFELEKMALAGNMEECMFSMGDTPLVAPMPETPLILFFNVYEAHASAVHRFVNGTGQLPPAWHMAPAYAYGNPFSLVGPGSLITFPAGEPYMDFECEIAAVLGEDVRDASLDDAEDAILGYTVANNWTARGLQKELFPLGHGYAKSKSFSTSLGPWIITKDEIADPMNLPVSVRLNGTEVSNGSTAGAAFSFAEMISYASESTLLPAGTIICSGAIRSGSGVSLDRFLRAGDTVELEVDGIGTLKNKIYERQSQPVFQPHK